MRESRIKEQFIGGHILYGYKVVNKKVEIDEDKADTLFNFLNFGLLKT